MSNHFKVGQKVRLVKHGAIGWEQHNWTYMNRFKIGEQFTIQGVSDNGDLVVVNNQSYHPDHFTAADPEDEQPAGLENPFRAGRLTVGDGPEM